MSGGSRQPRPRAGARDASRARRTSRSGSRRSSRSSTPTASSSSTASRSCAAACQAGRGARRVGRRRADRHRDRDPLGPRRDASPRRSSARREHRARLFATADRPRDRARGGRDPSVGELPRPADHRHASTTTACARSCAGSRSATTPGAFTSTSASAAPTARSRSCDHLRATLPPLLALSANSPFLDGQRHRPALGAHRDLHPHLPALRRPRAVRRLGDLRRLHRPARRGRAGSSSRRSCGGACARITRSARSSCGSATPRPAATSRPTWRRSSPPASPSRRSTTTTGASASRSPARAIEENLWQAIRHGLDGSQIDFDAPRGDPDAGRRSSALLEWTAPARDGPRARRRAARPQRRPARPRRLSRAASRSPTSTATIVAETAATYAP